MQRKNKVFLRGVINSDTPKGCHVSLLPCKGCRVSRRCLGRIPKIIFVNFIIFVIFVISGIEVACRSKEEGELYKNYNIL